MTRPPVPTPNGAVPRVSPTGKSDAVWSATSPASSTDSWRPTHALTQHRSVRGRSLPKCQVRSQPAGNRPLESCRVLSCQFTLLHVVLPAGRRFAPAGWLEPMLAREPVSAPCRADAAASMIWTSRSASSTHQMGPADEVAQDRREGAGVVAAGGLGADPPRAAGPPGPQ